MKMIGETSGGSVIVEMNQSDWRFLGQIAAACSGASAAGPAASLPPGIKTKPDKREAAPDAGRRGIAKRRAGAGPAAAPLGKKLAAKKPAAGKRDRNKTCVTCGAKFFDESHTASRRFCGQGKCVRSSQVGKKAPASSPADELAEAKLRAEAERGE